MTIRKAALPVVALLLVSAVPSVSCTPAGHRPTDRIVDLGTHSLHAVVTGRGSPAVVFDGGLGTRCEEYRELQDRIAVTTTVVAYDRAGYGSSGVGPLPRDSRREVEELRAMLTELRISRPFVLVGHSLGGLNAQVYADSHPDEVAGMVLLDPPPLTFVLGQAYPELASMALEMTEEWQRIADGETADAGFFRMLASEHRELFDSSATQASSIASFGDMPLVVMASGVPNPMFGDVAEDYQRFWAAESEGLSAKSRSGRYIFAETSTHQLHEDAADLVIETIVAMVKSMRASGDHEDTGS